MHVRPHPRIAAYGIGVVDQHYHSPTLRPPQHCGDGLDHSSDAVLAADTRRAMAALSAAYTPQVRARLTEAGSTLV